MYECHKGQPGPFAQCDLVRTGRKRTRQYFCMQNEQLKRNLQKKMFLIITTQYCVIVLSIQGNLMKRTRVLHFLDRNKLVIGGSNIVNASSLNKM